MIKIKLITIFSLLTVDLLVFSNEKSHGIIMGLILKNRTVLFWITVRRILSR